MRGDEPVYPLTGDMMAYASVSYGMRGMTIRERVAMAAMQGLLSNTRYLEEHTASYITSEAWDFADAWLAQREKRV